MHCFGHLWMGSKINIVLKKRAQIKFLSVENCNPHSRPLITVYGDDTMNINNFRRWVLRVKSSDKGISNVYDIPRGKHPVT